MRVLILSFYYRPDLSAGSFRTTALVASLRERLPAGSQVDVVTTLPNRYHSFAAEAPEHEEGPGLSVHRIALPPHQSGMRDQSRAFRAFARGVRARVRGARYDLVFATSSRLMTAVLGAWVARGTRARLYLDLRDIFADTIKDVLPGAAAPVAHLVFGALERITVGRAARVNLVSRGFLPYFTSRYPGRSFSCVSNGIDDEFLAASPALATPAPRTGGPGTTTILYAGNLGEGQGLHRIVPALAEALGERVRFRIIGDGGRRAALEQAVRDSGVRTVVLEPPMGRTQLLDAYRAADVLFLHLNDFPAFEKVLPSKLFEYGAMGKPILAGVAGYSAEFVREELENAALFPPGDVDAAVRALATLALEDRPRTAFLEKYARASMSAALADDILATAGGPRG